MRKTATLLEQSLRRAKDTTTLHYEGEIKRGSSRRTVAGREAGGTCHQVIRIIRRGDFPAPEALKSTATPQPPHHRPAAIPPLPLSASLSSGGAARPPVLPGSPRTAHAPGGRMRRRPPPPPPGSAAPRAMSDRLGKPTCLIVASAAAAGETLSVGPSGAPLLPSAHRSRPAAWASPACGPPAAASPRHPLPSPGCNGRAVWPFPCPRGPFARSSVVCPAFCTFFFWHACARDARLQAWISAVRDESPRLRCAGGRGFAHAAPAPVPAPAWRPGAPVFHSCSSATRTCLLRSTQAAELPLGVYTWRKPNSLSLLPSL